MSNLQFDHIRVDVRDIEVAEQFYRRALGLERIVRYELAEGVILQMGPGGRPPGVELWMELGLHPRPSATEHLAFYVEDVVRAVDHVRDCGYPVQSEPYQIGEETVAFIRDPDGHLIEMNDFKGRQASFG